jgi:anti-sigma factor RsiW
VTERRERPDCERVWDLFPSFLDRTLSAEDEERVRCHLDTCETCREELQALRLGRRVRGDFTPLPKYEEELAERRRRMLERLSGRSPDRRTSRYFRRWWWVAAGVAALVLAAVVSHEFRPPEQPGQPGAPRDVAQRPAEEPREVIKVVYAHEGVQIVWVFDSQFEP